MEMLSSVKWLSIVILLCNVSVYVDSNSFETSKSLFSPDGKILQIEYALKSVQQSALCFGIRANDGIVLAALPVPLLRYVSSDMCRALRRSECRNYLHSIELNKICVALTGIQSDCVHVLKILRERALNYKQAFGTSIPGLKLADFIAAYLHDYTTDSSSRPLAVSIILASHNNKPTFIESLEKEELDHTSIISSNKLNWELFHIDCSGAYYNCNACASDNSIDSKLIDIDREKIISRAFSLDEKPINWKELSTNQTWTLLKKNLEPYLSTKENKIEDESEKTFMQGVILTNKFYRI
mmetsp:Transcript_11516/g.11537  ORF Transcript_11516/g.11537 Transcript_11516/m.11537 type:complete len:297 (-) Transcript_11516:22-912(-)